MILNVHLNRKPTEYGLSRCNVAHIVELSHDDFIMLKSRPLDDYSFITDNKDKLQYDNSNTRQCIMFLDGEGDDGILVDPQGYSYPRYSAYVPNAKQLLAMEQYPSLQAYVQDMMDVVEEVTQLAVNSQENGEFHSDLSDIEIDFQPNVLDKFLLADMLNARPEFESVEYTDGELNAVISGEYLANDSGEEMSGMEM